MKKILNDNIIKEIVPGSIAGDLGIQPGDKLVSINGKTV